MQFARFNQMNDSHLELNEWRTRAFKSLNKIYWKLIFKLALIKQLKLLVGSSELFKRLSTDSSESLSKIFVKFLTSCNRIKWISTYIRQ